MMKPKIGLLNHIQFFNIGEEDNSCDIEIFDNPCDIEIFGDWKFEFIDQWHYEETLSWVLSELKENNLPAVDLDNFFFYGSDLKKLSLEEFKTLIPSHGEKLYHRLQEKLKIHGKPDLNQEITEGENAQMIDSHQDPSVLKDLDSFSLISLEPVVQSHEETETTTKEMQSGDEIFEDWRFKFIDDWNPQLSLFWVLSELKEYHLPAVALDNFTICGRDLKNLSLREFREMVPEYGEKLYYRLQEKLRSCEEDERGHSDADGGGELTALLEESRESRLSDSNGLGEEQTFSLPTSVSSRENLNSAVEPTSDSDPGKPLAVEKRPRGRPPSQNSKRRKLQNKVGNVWQFIRDLLLSKEHNPSVVSWVDREKGIFQFKDSVTAGKLWGLKKQNPSMNYGKMTRAIRHNYKTGYFESARIGRHVYKLGVNSQGWREETP